LLFTGVVVACAVLVSWLLYAESSPLRNYSLWHRREMSGTVRLVILGLVIYLAWSSSTIGPSIRFSVSHLVDRFVKISGDEVERGSRAACQGVRVGYSDITSVSPPHEQNARFIFR
jgi:hypothetical protein